MKDAIILGTRPEIIKCAPIVKEYERHGEEIVIIHTNQHYSFNMDKIFFDDLNIRVPDFNLNVGSASHAVQTAKIMTGIEELLTSQKVERILVQGDTNTVLGSALAASKIGVKIGHVEAGLRSFDREMPEEVNRVLTDHISDYLFCPTSTSRDHVLDEGISPSRVHVVGNTIVDATLQNYDIAKKKSMHVIDKFKVQPGHYVLLTAHRPGNVDDAVQLSRFVDVVAFIHERLQMPIIFPAHPRTKMSLDRHGMTTKLPHDVQIVDPVGYLEFLVLEKNAFMIFTDSGGVQEEACVLHRPCVTLRENTERPETVDVGSNIITGLDVARIGDAIDVLSLSRMEYEIPFGDGNTSSRIFNILHH